MAEKKKDEFKVSDRRLFTADGELRPTSDEQEKRAGRAGDKRSSCTSAHP